MDVDSILTQFPGPIQLTAGKNLFKIVLIACLVFEYFLIKALVEREGIPLVLWCVIIIVLLQMVRCTLVLDLIVSPSAAPSRTPSKRGR